MDLRQGWFDYDCTSGTLKVFLVTTNPPGVPNLAGGGLPAPDAEYKMYFKDASSQLSLGQWLFTDVAFSPLGATGIGAGISQPGPGIPGQQPGPLEATTVTFPLATESTGLNAAGFGVLEEDLTPAALQLLGISKGHVLTQPTGETLVGFIPIKQVNVTKGIADVGPDDSLGTPPNASPGGASYTVGGDCPVPVTTTTTVTPSPTPTSTPTAAAQLSNLPNTGTAKPVRVASAADVLVPLVLLGAGILIVAPRYIRWRRSRAA